MNGGQRWMCLFLLLLLGVYCCNSTTSVPIRNKPRQTGPSIPSRIKKWGEECQQPCSGQHCKQLAENMRFLVDFSVDPCEDFFGFACSANTRGTNPPIAKAETVDFKHLVKFPPKGFEYVNKFYLSCTQIDTDYSTEEVFAKCFEDGKCDEEEVEKYGDIFAQYLGYTHGFIKATMLPAVTPDWEELTRDMFGGEGWNWWDFVALGLRDFFYLMAFNVIKNDSYRHAYDVFRSNIFFAPMIDSAAEFESPDLDPSIHIVPMSIPKNLKNGDADYLTKYKALMKNFFMTFGGDPSTIDNDVKKILDMELQVGKINSKVWFSTETGEHYEYYDNTTPLNDSDYYIYDNADPLNDTNNSVYVIITSKNDFNETITIKELYDLVPSVEWKDFIEGALSLNHEFKIKRSTKVKIPSRKLMKEMGEWVENLSPRDQANLLIWRMFIKFANDFMHTGSGKGNLQEDMFTPFSETITRSDNCLAQIKTFFPYVHDDMFITKYIDKSTRDIIKTIFKELTMEFEKIIEESDWLSRRTQIRAKKKIKAMRIIIGELSPNTLDFRELKEQMSSQDYIGNILAIGNYKWDTLAKNITNEKKVRAYPAYKFNAYYTPLYNEVEVMAGLISKMMVGHGISTGIPRALVYGGFIATTLAHEMLHGFDDTGKMYDKDGFRLNWWKPSEDETYLNKTKCLTDQYVNFTIPYNGVEYQINCENCTIYPSGENIADNGGVKVRYRIYKRLPEDERKCMSDPDLPFTSDQLFWLGHAFGWCLSDHGKNQSYMSLLLDKPSKAGHYPTPWRVNTVLANQPEFAAAFKCPLGSHLNPHPGDRCTVW